MRPQYSLPKRTVVTTENTAKRYQPRSAPEDGQVSAHYTEDVHNGQQLALVDAEIRHGCHERHVFQVDALPKEARQRKRSKRDEQTDIDRLTLGDLPPRLTGSSSCSKFQGSSARRGCGAP